MCKPLYLILACVFVFSYGACALGRGTFQARLRHCRWLCAIRDSQQKNTIQTCTVLADHQNVTVSKCVSRCLVKHEENITNSTECQCENGKCMGKSATNESSSSSAPELRTSTTPASPPSTPEVSTSAATETSSTTIPPSTSSSSTTTQASTSTSSTSAASSPPPPNSSSPPVTSRGLIENFQNDEEDIADFSRN